ncbi:HEAT repeat domain-containing protein [Planococcus alpniumensis]|uniref:HEAT repeat domain-containing protein n=1 Tax=Planococcus alpniumensis TaxID=2708345 RepID=UPI001B8A9D7C|nr:HEAT repeat domain-containing protein [Planococcus sp. MSAK28401]
MKSEQKIMIIEGFLEQAGPDAIENIATFLEDEDPHVMWVAIEALGTLPISEKIKNTLLPLIANPDEEIRFKTLEALWGYTGDAVLNAVVNRLKDDDELVRISAVEALGEMRDNGGKQHLIDALTDVEEIVRREAAEGLGKLGDASAVPVLEAFLQNETSNTAKVGFYVGLYLLGAEFRLISLLNLLKDPSYQVRCSVANCVLDLVDKENEKLIIKTLNAALIRETTIAARFTLQSALEELNSSNDLL